MAGAVDSALAFYCNYLRAYLARRPNAQTVRLRFARLLAWSESIDSATSTLETIVQAQSHHVEAWKGRSAGRSLEILLPRRPSD
jgi:hypothetical protein